MDRPIPRRSQAGEGSQSRKGAIADNRGAREASSTKLQADFVANRDFFGFWMVNILREVRSQRPAP